MILRQCLRLLRTFLTPQAIVRGGPPHLYAIPPDASVDRMKAGLAALDAVGGSDTTSQLDDEGPIFICAVGWRVGSTLLQRICCTDERALIWGEPLGNMSVIPRIAEAICIAKPEAWPFQTMWLNEEEIFDDKEKLYREFIANFYPPAKHFRASLQQWVYRWLGESAKRLGFKRWGLKETRLSASDALFVRWLFPRAVFLPIIRDPIDAYRSCQGAGGDRWVEPRTGNAEFFAAHWNRLAMSWIDADGEFPLTMTKFEDLVSGQCDFSAFKRETGLDIDPEKAIMTKSGASTPKVSLSRRTEVLIRRVARSGMRAYGYHDRAVTR